mgnify:CR=1 FL=1
MDRSLADVLYKEPAEPFPLRRVLAVALDIARGLHYLHRCNPAIVHRDRECAAPARRRSHLTPQCDAVYSRHRLPRLTLAAFPQGFLGRCNICLRIARPCTEGFGFLPHGLLAAAHSEAREHFVGRIRHR